MNPLGIDGIGVCAIGIPDWNHARPLLRGEREYHAEPLPKLDVATLPVTERRRVNATSRLAIRAATEAVAHLTDDARSRIGSVFVSADGDGQILASTMDALVQTPVGVSPTLFHNSVFNAPAGYWAIANHVPLPSITVSAGAASFAAGLHEAAITVTVTAEPILLVAYDLPFPDALAAFGITGNAFAVAFLLGPAAPGGAPAWGTIAHGSLPVTDEACRAAGTTLASHFAGNAAAAALPLLEAIARRMPGRIALPYLDDSSLKVAYLP
jgi:hypothetical protein